jgi:hypothetical protein
MAKDDFIQNLRLAAGLVAPTVHTEGTGLDAQRWAARLSRAALWLTPRAVEGYYPADFKDLSQAEQKALDNAAARFRELADSVPADSPASDAQYREGLELLGTITTIVRKPILDEWAQSVEKLISDAEAWAGKHGWICRRSTKRITEKLLDSYQLAQLMIQVNGNSLLLDPVARFVPGALGVVDLSLLPAYHSATIPRKVDGWHLHIDTGEIGGAMTSEDWNENSFVDAVEWLRQRA